jgi:hypothetical protein
MAIELALDMQTIIPWVILMAGLIYETTMFIYRKATSGEAFSLEKYALTYGYVGLLAVLAYITTGVIPGVDEVMVRLTTVPDYTAVLPIITAVIFGIFQQGSRVIQAKTSTPVVTAPTTQSLPMGQVLGIYGGSAKSNPPQTSFTCDVNQIPMTLFDFLVTSTGKFMYQVFMDGKPLMEQMGTSLTSASIGKSIPYDFYINHNFRVPGTHQLQIVIGTQPQQDGNTVWNGKYEYPVTFTGTLPLE